MRIKTVNCEWSIAHTAVLTVIVLVCGAIITAMGQWAMLPIALLLGVMMAVFCSASMTTIVTFSLGVVGAAGIVHVNWNTALVVFSYLLYFAVFYLTKYAHPRWR
jgi:hypothetical protein